MSAVAVLARDAEYRAAMVELPLATRVADDPRGAIVVVPGGGSLLSDGLRAQAEGASAIVVADAAGSTAGDLEAMRASVGIPTVLARPRLRADVAAAAEPDPAALRAVVVEAVAPSETRRDVLRDAVGWARVLAGGGLDLVAHAETATGAIALLDRRGVPVTVLVSTVRGGAAAIRAHTVGHVRTDVTIDEGALVERIERTDADGTWVAPARFESLARLTLRRAIDAVRGETSDLADAVHDALLADRIMREVAGWTPAP